MPGIYNCKVIENKREGALFLMELQLEEPIPARPGQFFLIRIEREDILLRRAFSIFDLEEDRLSFLIRVVGKGTRWLSEKKKGDILNIFGPLGNGFSIRNGRCLLVGGGSGIAPLYYLAKNLKGRIDFLLGAETGSFWSEDLIERFSSLGNVELVTEDGSIGRKGLLTEYIGDGVDYIYACGPLEMLKGIKSLIPGEASLEATIGCGIGACRGCTVEMADGSYRRICKDGPIFDLKEIVG
jgi:dihydroorotate dehydrogenase electron transfer subunit